MSTLKEQLLTNDNRPRLVEDCVRLVESEVGAKSGLSGMAVKAAYAIVKKVKPGIIKEAVDRLIDGFVERMESFYSKHTEEGASVGFASYMNARQGEVASALLGVTDARIERANNRTIKKAYGKLRPTGVKHVEAAVPGVGRVVERYI